MFILEIKNYYKKSDIISDNKTNIKISNLEKIIIGGKNERNISRRK